MGKINVMITGVGGGGIGEQIIKCLQLSSLSYKIIGCDMNKTSKGLKEVDKAYIVPPASNAKYLDCILNICKENNVKVLFHGSEPEMKILSDNREIFTDAGIYIPMNPKSVINVCMDKNKTIDFLNKNGFSVPRYWEISDIEDLKKIDIFPVVLKPSIGGGGSINTFIAQDKDELLTFGAYLLKLYDIFTVQEYIGDVYNEYTVGVMSDSKGEYLNSIAVKKSILSGLSNKIRVPNRTGRNELGDILAISSGISQGEIGRFPEVTIPGRKMAQALGSTAALNVQCRLYNGKMYVFEINPRISGTSSLRAIVGYNEPEMLIREKILGEKIDQDFIYKEGYITRGLEESFISKDFMQLFEDRTEDNLLSGGGCELALSLLLYNYVIAVLSTAGGNYQTFLKGDVTIGYYAVMKTKFMMENGNG